MYDGTGSPAFAADIGVVGDEIAAIGPGLDAEGAAVLDCRGLSISPGFVNLLSHPNVPFLAERVGLSELAQGVTTQLFGEVMAFAPLWPERRRQVQDAFTTEGVDLDVNWDHVGEFLGSIERAGVAFNLASLVSANMLFYKAVGAPVHGPPSPEHLAIMCDLVEDEVQAGALGLGTALIYPPEVHLPPDAVLALASAAAKHGGRYFSHIRSEAAGLLRAVDEAIQISAQAGVAVEIWHLKASGTSNWPLMEQAIERITDARDRGLDVSANMYPYTASGTGLWNLIPARYRSGRQADWLSALDDPTVRATVTAEMATRVSEPEKIVLLRFAQPQHASLQGRTLAAAATELGLDPAEAVVELVRRDRSAIASMFFSMSEDNVSLAASQPWVSVGSDAAPRPLGGPDEPPVHPRAYGTFARFLSRYGRDHPVISMAEAIRRMTSQPAQRLGLTRRGTLTPRNFADIVTFDESALQDHATYDEPHQLATGVRHVIVNGQLTLRDGKPTGTLAGRALLG